MICEYCKGDVPAGANCPNCGAIMPDAPKHTVFVHTWAPPVYGRKIHSKSFVFLLAASAFVFIAVIGIFAKTAGDMSSLGGKTVGTPGTSASTNPASSAAAPVSVNLELGSGNYTVGVDLPAGVYDFQAVSGGGNVSTDNYFDGGINELMGAADRNGSLGIEMYLQDYSNVKLSEGVILHIGGGLILKVTCASASGQALKPRNQSVQSVDLDSGNYVAGQDFPEGVYDVTVLSGSGNVFSDNFFDAGINELMGTADKNTDMYVQSFRNLSLNKGVKLKISGVKIRLSPSK